jgi:DNA repair protein RadC
MSIHDWPLAERPREKLLYQGTHTLSDAELLAIFLRTGVKGKTAVDLARDLLNNFGGVRHLLEAPMQQFCQHHGLGVAKYAQLQAVLELAKRHLLENLKRSNALESSQDVQSFLMTQLRHRQQEIFACLFLDNRNRIIHYDELFHGTINCAAVYPREVVKRALAHNAAAVILAHNHPSGVAEPSPEDKSITQQLAKALSLVEIRVLDHMIIGDSQVISLAEMGFL